MNVPAFSIIVPVYNTLKEYLDVSVSSLLAQNMEEVEVILVDDGSCQTCAELCDSYAEKDKRVRVIHQENQGVSAARNQGIQAAVGKWVMFVDADDWIEPDTCKKLSQYLSGYNGNLLMYNAVKEYENKQTPIHFELENGCVYNMSEVKTREFFYRKAMRPQSTTGKQSSPIYYCWDKVYKRTFLLENQLGFPVGLSKSEDKVFMLTCIEKADSLYYVNDIFYHYRINEASVCHKFSSSADKDRVRLADILQDIAGRMDRELAGLTNNAEYNLISRDFYRFIFGIISDVLFLKYYHPDNPADKKSRTAAARSFVASEPFKTAIRACPYSSLSAEAKLKKFLLSKGKVSEFCAILKLYRNLTTKPQKQ